MRFRPCDKGTYVRSLARDLGRALGWIRPRHGALRRGVSGRSAETDMISLEPCWLCAMEQPLARTPARRLLPVETALDDIPALAVSRADAARLAKRGQVVSAARTRCPVFRGRIR